MLPKAQLIRYPDLLSVYQKTFGDDHVCWAPIQGFHVANTDVLIGQILPFLAAADQQNKKVVVHCSGGIECTGHVLAAWLIAARRFSSQAAVSAVKQTGKNRCEVMIAAPFNSRNLWSVAAELNVLLNECEHFRSKLN